MTPGEDFRHVSATLVREIAMMGGDVAQFVSPIVLERLRARVAARARGG
jgi:pantetheine-phosphate adenylyltransferase